MNPIYFYTKINTLIRSQYWQNLMDWLLLTCFSSNFSCYSAYY